MDISNIKQEELDIPRETKRTLDNGQYAIICYSDRVLDVNFF